MWLTRLAITRPVTILMLVLALVVLGLQSRSKLPVELYPNVEFPVVVITTAYPGTGPEEIETLVTKPIEDSVSAIGGLKKMTSTSSEGISTVVMQFELGTSLEGAASDVRSKLDALRNTLPQDAKSPVVIKADVGAIPVIKLSLSSKRRSSQEIRRLADDVVKDRLSQISGVAAVAVTGGDVREIRVEVDKARLEAYGVSIPQIVAALQAENLNFPSGSIEEARQVSAIRVMGEFTNPEQIRHVRIQNAAGNPNLTIGDIADVRDTVAKPDSYTRVDRGSSVALSVQKQSDANTVQVADGVRKQLELLTGRGYTEAGEKLQKAGTFTLPPGTSALLPSDIDFNVAMDQSTFVKDMQRDVYQSLFEGALLAVLIVFLFLHSFRGTFIVALAIPTSIITTFIMMNAVHFSMNMMSMMGLSLSVGILVDDSIVVIENIHRHLKMGKPPRQAAIDGRSEIGLAAMAITLVDVMVFVPVAFMGGIVGQFFRQFGIVVATATLCSLFISFTLTPMLASRWLKAHDEEEADEARQREHPGLFHLFVNAWETGYLALSRLYRRILEWALAHRPAVITLGVMTLISSIAVSMSKPDATTWGTVLPVMIVTALVFAGLWSLMPLAKRWLWRFFLFLLLFAGSVVTLSLVHKVLAALLKPEMQRVLPFVTALLLVVMLAFIGYFLHPPVTRAEMPKPPGIPLAIAVAVFYTICIFVPGHFGFEFTPKVDQRQFSVKIERAVGTSLAATDVTAVKVENALFDRELYPETKTVVTSVGQTSSSLFGGGGGGSDIAELSVELKDRKNTLMERVFGISTLVMGNRSTDQVVQDINKRFGNVPGAKITATIASGMGGSESPISIEVSGVQMARIQQVADQVLQVVKSTPGTYSAELSWRAGRPEMQAKIDRDRAAQYGISVAQISSALRTSLQGDTSVKYREEGREYDIRVMLPESQRNVVSKLPNMVVGISTAGRPVYLFEVVRLQSAAGPTKLERTNRQRTVTVNGQIAEGYTLGVMQPDIAQRISALDTHGVNIVWAGQAQQQSESFGDMGGALLLSVILVFMLMAALFESVLAPFIIMLAVPQAMAGALFLLTFTNKSLNIITMIGIIMLVGLVTKNAILLVDFTNTLRREHGLDRHAALLQAGPTRLRPILMTTLAMISGMLPTALALAKGSEMRQPLAIAVIGGLALSMFLTLLMVPVFYEIVDSTGEAILSKIGRLFGVKSTESEHTMEQELAGVITKD